MLNVMHSDPHLPNPKNPRQQGQNNRNIIANSQEPGARNQVAWHAGAEGGAERDALRPPVRSLPGGGLPNPHLPNPKEVSQQGEKKQKQVETRQESTTTSPGMQEVKGRLNVMHSDLPYAAFWGEDCLPNRRHLFHISNLPPPPPPTPWCRLPPAWASAGRVPSSRCGSGVCSLLFAPVEVQPPIPLLVGWGLGFWVPNFLDLYQSVA